MIDLLGGFRESAGAAEWKNSAAHEDIAPAEAIHLEVGAGLCRHRPRHAVVPRTPAGSAGRVRQGQGDALFYERTMNHVFVSFAFHFQ